MPKRVPSVPGPGEGVKCGAAKPFKKPQSSTSFSGDWESMVYSVQDSNAIERLGEDRWFRQSERERET